MSLAKELSNFHDQFRNTAPESVVKTITDARENFVASFDPSKILQVGERFPSFQLRNATDGITSSSDLLAKSALLIHFYRGEWCPFCNLDLRAIQKQIGAIRANGANLVAISPELPSEALTVTEKHSLDFEVLSDTNLTLANKLNIVWQQPQSFKPVFDAFGNDMEKRTGLTGGEALKVPIPATFLIGKDGIVKAVHADPDYTKRLDPAEMVTWLDRL